MGTNNAAKCRECRHMCSIEKFYSNRAVCKSCYIKGENKRVEKKGRTEVSKLIEKNIIKQREIKAALTLYSSCKSRISACKNDKAYKHIKCFWKCPLQMIEDIILNKPLMWRDWKDQFTIYHRTKKLSDRPSIDRIDEFGNYTLGNIQMLSVMENSKKAKSKPSKALLVKSGNPIYSFSFNTKKEMMKELRNVWRA